MAGVEPRFEHVETADPIAYSWSLNGPRRHLTKSQLAMAGARMRELYDRQAKERMRQGGGDRKSEGAGSGKEHLPDPIPDAGQARDQVGKLVGVSGKTIDAATKVIQQGTPELVQAVEKGRIAVTTAATLAVQPEEVQRAAVTPLRHRSILGKCRSTPRCNSSPEAADFIAAGKAPLPPE
jgi:hypothetical protein